MILRNARVEYIRGSSVQLNCWRGSNWLLVLLCSVSSILTPNAFTQVRAIDFIVKTFAISFKTATLRAITASCQPLFLGIQFRIEGFGISFLYDIDSLFSQVNVLHIVGAVVALARD
jgi:hypothetical protein